MDSVRSRLRSWFAWLFRWTVSAEAVPSSEQSAWQRAKVDTSLFAARWPIWFGALVTAGVAAAGILVAAWTSGHSTPVMVVCGVVGALVGFFLVIALVSLICWLRAFPKQRNEARREVRRLEAAAVAETQQESVESQFAAALRAGRALPTAGPLVLEWMNETVNLVRETFGELQAAQLESQTDADGRLVRLDAMASELGEGRSLSESWALHVVRVNALSKALQAVTRAGDQLHTDIMAGTADPSGVASWADELQGIFAPIPGLASMSAARGQASVVTRTYDGVNDDSAATSALNRLDDRLPALRAMTPVVGTYVAAIGEPDDA